MVLARSENPEEAVDEPGAPRQGGDATSPFVAGALLERSEEIDQLDRALGIAAAHGRGACLLLEGPAGIGKTSLLDVAVSAAACEGFGILDAKACALESDFVFGMARALFEPALAALPPARRVELLSGSARPAAQIFEEIPTSGAARDPADRDTASRAVLALHQLTLALAAERPLLVAADDLHWADEPSLRFLTYLARRLAALPIVVVVAARPAGEWLAPAFRHGLLRHAGACLLRPRPLSSSAVGELIERRTARPPEAPFARACRRSTGGNPFYLVELLRTLTERGIAPIAANAAEVASVGPAGVMLSVDERLDQLPREAAAVAEAIAVLGDGCPVAWLTELTKLDAGGAAQASDALRQVDILEGSTDLAFAHPILATSVHDAIPAGRRATLHAACAEIAHRHGAPPEVVASHVLRSVPGITPFAVTVLRKAAAEALRRGSPAVAQKYLRRALLEVPRGAERPAILVELGCAEALVRHPDAPAHLEEALASVAGADERIAAALALWSTRSFDGRVAEGLDMLRDVLARSGAQPEGGLRLELELARATRSMRATADEGRRRIAALAQQAADFAPELRRVILGLVAYDALLANEPVGEVLALVEQALPLDDTVLGRSESQLLHLPLYTLIWCDALGRVRTVLEELEAASARRGAAMGSVIADLWATLAALRAGALTEAELRGSKALAGAVGQGWLFGRAGAQLLLAEIATERGELVAAANYDAAVQVLLEADPDVGDKGWADHMLHGRGLTALASGRVGDAVALLLDVGRRHEAWLARCPSELPWRSNAALALHLAGEQGRAGDLAAEEVDLARAFGAPRALGIALRVQGVVAGCVSSLRESAEVLSGSVARLEHARVLCDLGRALRTGGQEDEARAVLHAAITGAEALGATALVRRARAELRAAGGRTAPPAASGRSRILSSSEVRVAQMAAHGMSNPEIAKTLFLSRRTVETHLYNLYRKLGIRSRDELPAALAAVRPGVPPARTSALAGG